MGFDCMKHLLPDVTHPHNETRRQRMIGNGEPLLLHRPHLRCKLAVSKSRHKWLCPFYSVMMVFFTEACSSPNLIMQHEVRYFFTQLECSVPENVTWNWGELIQPFATLFHKEGLLVKQKVHSLVSKRVLQHIAQDFYVSLLGNIAINFFALQNLLL